MTGYELAEKYKVTILGWPLDKECPETCVCGHHISLHYGIGSAGYCKLCAQIPYTPHNFQPIQEKMRIPLQQEMRREYIDVWAITVRRRGGQGDFVSHWEHTGTLEEAAQDALKGENKPDVILIVKAKAELTILPPYYHTVKLESQ